MLDSNSKGTPLVLVIAEDPEMRELLSGLIRSEGFRSESLAMPEAITGLSLDCIPALLVFDGMSRGPSLDALWRAARAIPRVLMIADSEPSAHEPFARERISFLPRPFDRATLCGRVRALIGSPGDFPGCLNLGALRLDLRSQDVECEGVAIRLTLSEFKLLHELARNAGQVLSREHLIRRVQGEGVAVVDRAIDTHVVSLRKKLGLFGGRIETVRGEGYRLLTPPCPISGGS
ncbi:DNA-binding response regulator [bacterium]|jgi:DNA-binding response OmpR family regulator|nr:DNA-binding response regulator [bacterium]